MDETCTIKPGQLVMKPFKPTEGFTTTHKGKPYWSPNIQAAMSMAHYLLNGCPDIYEAI